MPIITLSRELGSYGDDVARAVSEELGLRLVNRDLINRAAREAGAPEVALAEIDELGLLGVKPAAASVQVYLRTVREMMCQLAAAGDVLLVGRGGQVVLAETPGVLHVRLIAPREMRIATVQERCRIAREAAAARVDASDRARANYVRRHHGVQWDDPRLYDLVLNLARLGVAAATRIVCAAAGRAEASPAGRDTARLDPEACE